MIHVGRTSRTPLAQWWWTVDRWILFAVLGLVAIGLVLSFAASPAVAQRLNLPGFHFVFRQILFLLPALFILVTVSMLSVRQVRWLALVLLCVNLVLMGMTLVVGPEIKGATRWLPLGPFALQPSEFVKPAFTVIAAWLFAEGIKAKNISGPLLALVFYGIILVILVGQPDFGQLVLLTMVLAVIAFLSGLSWNWISVLGFLATAGAFAAYRSVPHVTSRVDRFLEPQSGDTYQIDRALEAFRAGGFLGKGPGAGEVKRILPDAHADFVFAVAAEEFGVLAGLLILSLFALIVIRVLLHARGETDFFVQLSTAALSVLVGVQALINMAVTLHLLPAKGMTLPFISYGGSSLLAVALTLGMLLALTRRRAGTSLSASTGEGNA